MLAWFRRIIVSLGVGGTSYALMLAFMVASIVYDRELEPVVTFAFETGRQITDLLELVGIRKLLGTGCSQSSSRTGEHDPCRAFNSGNRPSRHIGRHSFKSDSGWHPKLVSTPCHCDCEYTSYSYPCRDVVHLQRACPGNVCSAVALRGLDLAGVAKRTQRLGRFDSRSTKIDERCSAGVLRTPLRHHGVVQCNRRLFGQCSFCIHRKVGRTSIAHRQQQSAFAVELLVVDIEALRGAPI